MKRDRLRKLAMAVAAAGLLVGGITKAVSTEISASSFVTNLQQYVDNGEYAAAKEALRQLMAFGINQIMIGDQYYLIADLLLALDNPEQARAIIAALSVPVTGGVAAYFVAETRVVASVNWTDRGIFPTGSAGNG
jgi:hypothetical protein